MTLNTPQAKTHHAALDSATGSTGSTAASEPDADARRHLTDELLDELTTWNPRERMGAFKAWLRESLSLIHLHVLTVLEAEGPQTMSHLADALDVSVASATGIVGRMEERGLVERHHADADRRIVTVTLTNAGRNVFRDMERVRRYGLSSLLGQLTEHELSGFLAGLRAMKAARIRLGHDDPRVLMHHPHIAVPRPAGRHRHPMAPPNPTATSTSTTHPAAEPAR